MRARALALVSRAIAFARPVFAGPPWPVPPTARGRAIALGCGMLLLVSVSELLLRLRHGSIFPEDDAYYYKAIARHLAHSGISAIDGLTPTNGYHPLWLLILTLQERLVGSSMLATFLIEAMLLSGALVLFLLEAPAYGLKRSLVFAAAYGLLFFPMAVSGMEAALTLACVALLCRGLRLSADGGLRSALLLGAAAAATIGARIDSAAFVLVAVAMAPAPPRSRALALGLVAALALAYAAINLQAFGLPFPVSGAIKSLGGLQINRPFLAEAFDGAGWPLRRLSLMVYGFVAAAGLCWITRPRSRERALCVASAVGGGVYLFKIVFFSSWRIWAWYNVAAIFPLVGGFYALSAWLGQDSDRRLALRSRPLLRGGLAMLCALPLALETVQRASAHELRWAGSEPQTRLALHRFLPVLAGSTVAMGDRSGLVAAEYPGRLVQLEGLVEDKAYFDLVRAGGDGGRFLCGRGVRYILAYEPPLGAYRTHTIRFLRPGLTQYPGPTLTVSREDEVDHVAGGPPVPGRSAADSVLYLWKFGRCG